MTEAFMANCHGNLVSKIYHAPPRPYKYSATCGVRPTMEPEYVVLYDRWFFIRDIKIWMYGNVCPSSL